MAAKPIKFLELHYTMLRFLIIALTMHPTKASVKTLCVYRRNIFSVGSMKELSLIVSSIVFIHFLLSHHVGLIKMRILNSLNFLNIHSASCCSNFLQDTLVLRGTWGECHFVYCHVRAWHWCPVLWKRHYWKTKNIWVGSINVIPLVHFLFFSVLCTQNIS